MSGDIRVINLNAEAVQAGMARDLSAELSEMVDQGIRWFVFDISGIEMICSTALGVMVFIAERVRGLGGDVSVAGPAKGVREVMRFTGLHLFLKAEKSVADCLRILREGSAGQV
jgi:anti-anti-sigma factor